MDRHVEELGVAFAGGGAGQQGLAAAGRAVEQDAAADPLAEALEERRLLEGQDDPLADLLLDLGEAAEVGEGGPGGLGVEQPAGFAFVGVVVGDHPQLGPFALGGEDHHPLGQAGS